MPMLQGVSHKLLICKVMTGQDSGQSDLVNHDINLCFLSFVRLFHAAMAVSVLTSAHLLRWAKSKKVTHPLVKV